MLSVGLTEDDCLRRTNESLVLLLEIRHSIIARLCLFRCATWYSFFPGGMPYARHGVLSEKRQIFHRRWQELLSAQVIG